MINKKGFTLIEVLIAVGIVTIVSAVVLALINPDRQRNRARDAVLQKAVSGLAESVENFRNLRGENITCDSSVTPGTTNLTPYISDEINLTVDAACLSGDASGLDYIKVWNNSIYAGQAVTDSTNPIYMYITDASTPPVAGSYCIEAQTNDDTTFYYVWTPGSSVNRTDQSTERCVDLLTP